jgi:hypothetical protein
VARAWSSQDFATVGCASLPANGNAVFPKIVPYLWYTKDAEEAARFYSTIFPDSHVDKVTPLAADTPSGPAGSVIIVELRSSAKASPR